MASLRRALLSLTAIVSLAGAVNAEEGVLDKVRNHVNGVGVRTTYVPSSEILFSEYSLETQLNENLSAGLSIHPIPSTDQSFDYGAYGNVRRSMLGGNVRLLSRVNDDLLIGGEAGITREHLTGNGVNEIRFPMNYSLVSDLRIADHIYLTGRLGIIGLGRWFEEFSGNGYDGTLNNLAVSAGLNFR